MKRMRYPPMMRWLVLLGALLTACAASTPVPREEDEALEPVASLEEAREDPSCVVPLCDEAGCKLWRCRDVGEEAHPIVLARGPLVQRPPMVGSPSRWWGYPVAAPTDAEPVFEIPWHNWNFRGQQAPRPILPRCIPPKEPLEKHHIFPQEERLATWFEGKGIDIHAFTIRVPKSFHTWLHSGGPKGGQWNEAWREFRKKNDKANADEIWRFAGELMIRFGVNGHFVHYYCD